MKTPEIPQLIPRPTQNPEPAHPGLESRIGDEPKPIETTASKKVDDISRHESKHDMDPKHAPKQNAREKATDGSMPGHSQPQPGTQAPAPAKK
jgi:hypothetical protein